MVSIVAVSVILASFVNLWFIHTLTSRPRIVYTSTFEESVSGTAAALPRPDLPIEVALRKGDVPTVKQHMYWCIKDGTCNLERNLHDAVVSNQVTVAKVLLAAGAKVNAKDGGRETPLHSAAMEGSTSLVQVLLDAGADVNARDEEGLTPLHSAASWGHIRLVRLLIEAGADVNIRDRNDQTPLHLVASRRVPPLAVYADVTKVLLEAGARPYLRAADGSTPLQRAESAATRLKLDGNLKATGDANEVVMLLRGSRGYH